MKSVYLLLLLCGLSTFGQGTTNAPNHYAMLKQATVFSISGGITGAITPAGNSLRAIAKQKDAAIVFTKLTHEDSPTAKLYGLLGLQMISSDQFKNELSKLLTNKSSVRVLEGCIMGTKDVAVVAKEIEQGRWSFGLSVKETK